MRLGQTTILAITYDTTGRIETLSSGGTTTTFTYDVPARKVTRTDVTPAGTFTSIYKSDANDNLSELTYPSGRVLTYHYDGENRLTSFDHQPLNGTNAVFAHGFSYGDDGRLASYVTGAVTHRFTYEFNRTKRLWTTGGSDALDLTYGYDNVGNVSSVTDPRPNANQTFVPDPLDRLETATGPWGTLQWSYDAAGNRLSELAGGTTTTYTYNTTNQRLTSTSGGVNETFGYDNVGRVTSDAVATYSYSPTGKAHRRDRRRGECDLHLRRVRRAVQQNRQRADDVFAALGRRPDLDRVRRLVRHDDLVARSPLRWRSTDRRCQSDHGPAVRRHGRERGQRQ